MKKILFALVVALAMCSCLSDFTKRTVEVTLSNPQDGSAPRVVTFEFDADGELVAPLAQLVSTKKNSCLRVYTYDRHMDKKGDKGYKEEVVEVFYFDNDNKLVKYEYSPDKKEYFISYDKGEITAIYSDARSNYLRYTHKGGVTTKTLCTRDDSEVERYKFTHQNMPEPLRYTSENYAYCMANKLNMRQRSYSNMTDLSKEPVVESINYGDCLVILSDADEYGWMQVRSQSGRQGFVMCDYVVKHKDYLRFQSVATPEVLKKLTQSRDRIVMLKYLKRNGLIGRYANQNDADWQKYFGDNANGNYEVLNLSSVKVVNNDEYDYVWSYRYGVQEGRKTVWKSVFYYQYEDSF